MDVFALSIVVEPYAIDDDAVINRLIDGSEGMRLTPSVSDGVYLVGVEAEAGSVAEVIDGCLETIRNAYLVPVRVELELVNTTEIAEYLNVSRQAVAHWVAGSRGGGDFPLHYQIVSGSKLWTWSDVQQWAMSAGKIDREEFPLALTSLDVFYAQKKIERMLQQPDINSLLSA